MTKSLADLVAEADNYKGSWYESQLSWAINASLWKQYDPKDNSFFPHVYRWDKLLQQTIDNSSYDKLSKDEILSILFGLHCRNRIIDELWTLMFERGVTQKLLVRLLTLDSDKF